ncbi:hypothetical protein M404DRAFT_556973 [Pisolithus tinctorius Marx 270]|uniref:Uncharacterized protein n=1 Tax=Pisolithus tinctorius Marx 270 TaxID=870435 RepID=A0A0C3P9K2_PISTI|nr:hypothetical protein M404DRAFT_556973 [Pisolithus tinctorius Marx 270]
MGMQTEDDAALHCRTSNRNVESASKAQRYRAYSTSISKNIYATSKMQSKYDVIGATSLKVYDTRCGIRRFVQCSKILIHPTRGVQKPKFSPPLLFSSLRVYVPVGGKPSVQSLLCSTQIA